MTLQSGVDVGACQKDLVGFFGSMDGVTGAVEADGDGLEEMTQERTKVVEDSKFSIGVVAVFHRARLRRLMMCRLRAAHLSVFSRCSLGNVP